MRLEPRFLTVDLHLRPMELHLPTVDSQLLTADLHLRMMEPQLPTAEMQLPAPDLQLPAPMQDNSGQAFGNGG